MWKPEHRLAADRSGACPGSFSRLLSCRLTKAHAGPPTVFVYKFNTGFF